MQCPRCHHDNLADAAFCQECGARLDVVCAGCGTGNQPTAKFCRKCGQRLDPDRTGEAGSGVSSPQAYTPKHLAEKILTSRSALEGERKQVTVLFADLKGSMELLADRDPEEARKILDPVLERMIEAVHHYEGTVNQVMGDGIMALFGAPLAHEDHAVRASYAALRMQASVRRYAEDIHRSMGLPLHIRVGLNSGEVVVRSIASDLHMDYTAVGQTTHLAARMEQMAMPGSILIPQETLNLAEGYVQVKALGPRPVKGLETPIEIYELVGASSVRSRLQAAVARGLTRFVGRDAELDQLGQALARARGGHGHVVGVVGEPGVGKSRLFWEFTHSHRTQGWLLLEAGSASYGKATPYLPVIDLLKAYFQLEGRDDGRKIREKVTGKLLALDEGLRPALPALLALLDVPVEDSPWQALDPPQRRQRTLDALKRLLLRESQVQPLCLVFEDLHWIDGETQALLDSLVESLPTARLLLLLNYRPEYRHGWGSKTYYSQLRLDPLPRAGAEELLETLLGSGPDLAPLKTLLIERTEGNPFFLEESVRALAETQALAGDRGAYRLVRPISSIQVPATVQAVLAARIDRLAPDDKRVLQSASVIGETASFAILQAVADMPEDGLRQALDRLQAAELLYETSLFPDLEYTFKHGLTYQVAYTSLLLERRRTLHVRILEAMERLYADRLGEQIERVASHAFRGEAWEKAAIYLRQAGAKAFAHSANRQAVAYYEQGLAALSHLPESQQTLEQAIDLRFDLRTSLFPLGEMNAIVGHLQEADRLARVLGDQRRLGWVSVYMAHYSQATGDSRRASEAAQAAHTIGEALADFALQTGARFYLGWSAFSLGDYLEAEGHLRDVMAALEPQRRGERCQLTGFPAVMSRWMLSMCLAARGELDEGIAVGREGIRIAEELDHAYSLILACWGPVDAYRIRGELDEATRLGERALALCRDWNIAGLSPLVRAVLGDLYARAGRIADGVGLLEEGLAAIESTRGGSSWDANIRLRLGEAYARLGRLDQASAAAERALLVARERGNRGCEAESLRVLGELALQADPPGIDTAKTHYRQALALAEELGMRPLAAHCHLGLGRLHGQAGRRHEADESLTRAATMFSEMKMRAGLVEAESQPKEWSG